MTTLKDNLWKIDATSHKIRCDFKKDIQEAIIKKNNYLKLKIEHLKQVKKNNNIIGLNTLLEIYEEELEENLKIFGNFEEKEEK